MDYQSERRKYQRCTSKICRAAISNDKCRWTDVELKDISAGGLKFVSQKSYGIGTPVYFDLCIYNMLSEFNLKISGKIVRKEIEESTFAYAVKFDDIDKHHRVQLDEIIRSKISVQKSDKPVYDDGLYMFLFMPRPRSRKIKSFR